MLIWRNDPHVKKKKTILMKNLNTGFLNTSLSSYRKLLEAGRPFKIRFVFKLLQRESILHFEFVFVSSTVGNCMLQWVRFQISFNHFNDKSHFLLVSKCRRAMKYMDNREKKKKNKKALAWWSGCPTKQHLFFIVLFWAEVLEIYWTH